MTEFNVEALPFHPAQIWQWDDGYVAVGIDGEFLKLDSEITENQVKFENRSLVLYKALHCLEKN